MDGEEELLKKEDGFGGDVLGKGMCLGMEMGLGGRSIGEWRWICNKCTKQSK